MLSRERRRDVDSTLIGRPDCLQTASGERFEGVFMGGERQAGDWSVTLGDVRPAGELAQQAAADRARVATRTFAGRELAHVVAKDVKLQGGSEAAVNGSSQFGTDAEISRRHKHE